jgi:hypothetical protein
MRLTTVDEFKAQIIMALEAVGEIAVLCGEVGGRENDREAVRRAIDLVERYGERAAFANEVFMEDAA